MILEFVFFLCWNNIFFSPWIRSAHSHPFDSIHASSRNTIFLCVCFFCDPFFQCVAPIVFVFRVYFGITQVRSLLGLAPIKWASCFVNMYIYIYIFHIKSTLIGVYVRCRIYSLTQSLGARNARQDRVIVLWCFFFRWRQYGFRKSFREFFSGSLSVF